MNSNEHQNERKDELKGRNRPTGSKMEPLDFDQQVRHLLEEAEVPPPPDFFDNIQAELVKQRAREPQHTEAPNQKNKEVKVLPIRRFRRRWSYAASIGVLILLSLGFWQLPLFTGKDQPITSMINPNTLLSSKQNANGSSDLSKQLNPSHQQDIKGKKGIKESKGAAKIANGKSVTENSGMDAEGSEAAANGSRSTDQAGVSSGSRGYNRVSKDIKNNQVRTVENSAGRKPEKAGEGGTELGARTAQDHKASFKSTKLADPSSERVEPATAPSAVQAGAVVTNGSDLSLDPPAALAQNKLGTDNTVKIQGALEPTGPTMEVESSKSQVAKVAVSQLPASERPAEGVSNGREPGRERKGLFRVLVHHLKDRVDEISEKIVDEDKNKTRIQFGCIAITTYK